MLGGACICERGVVVFAQGGPRGSLMGRKAQESPRETQGPEDPWEAQGGPTKGPGLLCWFLQPLGPGPEAREGQGENKEGPEEPRKGPERAQGEPRGGKGPSPVGALRPRVQ